MKAIVLVLTLVLALSAPALGKGPKDTSPGNSGEHKVTICHVRGGGNPPITITVDKDSQVQAHLRHGDSLGPCPTTQPPDNPPPTTTTPTPTTTTPTPPSTTPAETPSTPVYTVPTETTPTPTTPTEEEPGQLVSPERVSGPKTPHRAAPKVTPHKSVQAVRNPQTHAQLVKQAGGSQLPYTGVPAGLIALGGLSLLGGGLALRRKLATE